MMSEGVQSDLTPTNVSGKRNTKKMTPAEGAISWDTVADGGEVDQDDDESNLNPGIANKNVRIGKEY